MKRHAKVRTAGSTTRWAPSPRGNRIAFVCILALLTCVGTGASSASAASAPTIDEAGAVQITDTSARLVAVIDPGEAETGYVFKYGPTPALGGETEPATIAAGSTPVIVSQLIEGLAPETTYSFQVVVVNGEGDDTSVTQTFKTRKIASPGGPDRAYEMVTNFDKGGNHVTSAAEGGWLISTAADGEAVGLCAVFAGDESATAQTAKWCSDYVMRRGREKWVMQPTLPRYCGQDLVGTGINPALGGTQAEINYSVNLDRAVLQLAESGSCDVPTLDPGAPTPSKNLYLADLLATPNTYELLTPLPAPNAMTANSIAGTLRGNSADFTHLVYQSTGRQVEGLPPTPTNRQRLFEWHNGALRVVSREPGTNALIESNTEIAGSAGQRKGYRPVSNDGRLIYFQALATPDLNNYYVPNKAGPLDTAPASMRLLVRENGATTYDVGQTECTSTCGTASGEIFQWGSADGTVALFFSKEKLLNEDNSVTATTADLYMYRHSENPSTDKNLYLLTRDHEPADGTDGRYRGVLGGSDDGNVIYFVTEGQIIAGAPTNSGAKLYRWRWNNGSPNTDYLGSVKLTGSPSESDNWVFTESVMQKNIVRRVTSDGRYLFMDLVTRMDPIADRDDDYDVYRWSEAEGWTCLSCQEPGVPSLGEASTYGPLCPPLSRPVCKQPNIPQDPRRMKDFELVNNISADGERAFFVAQEQLVPEDLNTSQDVYEWHGGRLRLISPGDAEVNAYLVEASPSGRDVFFITEQPLVGWDVDALQDIYVARSGGGQPEPTPSGVPCEGEACRGAGSEPTSSAIAATTAAREPGNVRQVHDRPACRTSQVRRGKRCVSKRALAKRACAKRKGKAKRRCVAKRACAKRKGKAKRRCVTTQVRRLSGAGARSKRTNDNHGRAGK